MLSIHQRVHVQETSTFIVNNCAVQRRFEVSYRATYLLINLIPIIVQLGVC